MAPNSPLDAACCAYAVQLRLVLDLGEAMPGGDVAGPVVEPAVADLLHAPAHAAGQVVMVPPAAQKEGHLAVVAAQRVGVAGVRETLQVPVHGGEPDALETGVQLLCRDRALGRAQRVEDGLPLLCSPAHRSKR